MPPAPIAVIAFSAKKESLLRTGTGGIKADVDGTHHVWFDDELDQ
ncbi:hypothetical protein [Streptomyces sp. NPDC050704]